MNSRRGNPALTHRRAPCGALHAALHPAFCAGLYPALRAALYAALCAALYPALLAALSAWTIVGCSTEEKTYSVPEAADGEDSFAEGSDLPPAPKTLEAFARVLVSQGKDDQAQFVLLRITREHPQYLPAYVELSELYLRNGRVDDAAEALIVGLRIAPSDPVLLNNLGMCWLLRRDYSRALDTFTAAAASMPEDARYRSNMATALGMLGRYDEAIALYEQVVPLDEAHHNLAVVCQARGDDERAGAEFALAERIREEGPEAARR